jgi:hypothetical protein
VLYQGKQVVTFEDGIRKPLYEHQYSDTLLTMLLRAANPAKYNTAKETINLLELEPELLTSAQLGIVHVGSKSRCPGLISK